MTREEAIKELQESLDTLREYDIAHSSRLKQALELAIKALSQEPCETIHGSTYGGVSWGGAYKPQEPCDDTVSIQKDAIKTRVGNIVAYNVEWLKKHWQMEMDIVCGVKPCDDVVSREDAIKAQCEACDICGNMRYTKCQYFMQGCNEVKCLRELPSINPQPCDDAISRSDMFDAIGHGTTYTSEELQRVIQNLPSVTQKSGKWIPVSERLPKDEQEVLITYKINVKHHVWSAIWDELHCRFYDKKYRNYISVNFVVAWMPLPEPYEPQESEDV